MFEIGKTMTWHRLSDDRRRTDEIPVTILKIAKNGVIVEMTLENGGTRKARVARDRLLPVRPPPSPLVRSPVSPPPSSNPNYGRIPAVLPKPWDPMRALGDEACVIHAVPTGSRALCGDESATGWQWARGQDVTCEQCWRKHLEAELERDSIVRCMRKCGYEGPITWEDYISFNWAGCSIRPWTAEHEDSLPRALQDWDRFYKLAKRRSQRRNKEAEPK